MESNTLPKRKNIRLQEYDYSAAGGYFLTLCTAKRTCILSSIMEIPAKTEDLDFTSVGARIARPFEPVLTDVGKIVRAAIETVPLRYSGVAIDGYVIMPNHVHLLITLAKPCGPPMAAPTRACSQASSSPTVGRIINQLKGYVSKRVGKNIWQKNYYDHVLRDASDYDEKMKYVYENPLRWYYDELYNDE